jgi:hypothetical protein
MVRWKSFFPSLLLAAVVMATWSATCLAQGYHGTLTHQSGAPSVTVTSIAVCCYRPPNAVAACNAGVPPCYCPATFTLGGFSVGLGNPTSKTPRMNFPGCPDPPNPADPCTERVAIITYTCGNGAGGTVCMSVPAPGSGQSSSVMLTCSPPGAILTLQEADCFDGAVNAGAGPVTSVLFVNGFPDFAAIAVNSPITISHATAPAGPSPTSTWVTWIWASAPRNSSSLVVSGQNLGCTVNPTPLNPGMMPQPFRCLRGSATPAAACGSVTQLPAPASAPWSITRMQGLANPIVLTFQGVIRDFGAANSLNASVTNKVLVSVQ